MMQFENYSMSSMPSHANNSVLNDTIEGVNFEAFFAKKIDSNKLVVMFPGAIDRSKLNPPIYHRWSWHHKIHANVLVLNDPTLYLAEYLRIGWLIGTKETDYTKIAQQFILKTLKNIFPGVDEVCFYSSSAGGFMAMQIAANFPMRCKVLVNNCQTNILKYHRSHVKDLTELVFPGMSHSDIEIIYGERVCLIKRYQHSPIPRTVYLQSVSDTFHLNNHCLPFINGLNSESITDENRLSVHFYRDDERGHGPLGQDRSLSALHKLLQE